MWKRKTVEDPPLDKNRDYKRDLAERLSAWTSAQLGISHQEEPELPDVYVPAPRESCTSLSMRPASPLDVDGGDESAGTCAPRPIPSHVHRMVVYSCPQIRSTPSHKFNYKANPLVGKCLPDQWRNRRMLKVARVPVRGSCMDVPANPFLFYDPVC